MQKIDFINIRRGQNKGRYDDVLDALAGITDHGSAANTVAVLVREALKARASKRPRKGSEDGRVVQDGR